MDYQAIIAGTVGKDNTYGTIVGPLKAVPFTYCRVSTDDLNGDISAYLGEGELTDDTLKTFGGYGVVHIPEICRGCWPTSARTASSITWPSTLPRWRARLTRPSPSTWAGASITINRIKPQLISRELSAEKYEISHRL